MGITRRNSGLAAISDLEVEVRMLKHQRSLFQLEYDLHVDIKELIDMTEKVRDLIDRIDNEVHGKLNW